MDTKLIAVAIAALIVGGVGGYALTGNRDVPNQHMMPDGSTMHGQMNDMMMGLNGKTGDEFDIAFLSEMIVHHEGAVEMAEAALANAQHEEIRRMATEIISAQMREIQQMKEWKEAWYGQ